ncbi:MAG: GGDEF domain-containing protein [Sterolibacterium sp.]
MAPPVPGPGRWRRFADSLLFRMILFGLFLVVVGSTARILVLKEFVREHVEALAAADQMSIASYIARDIDLKISVRQGMLERLARELPRNLLGRPRDLQTWLADRQKFDHPFSNGLLVIPPDGASLIAEYPEVPGRKQLRFDDQDWFKDIGNRAGPVIVKSLRSRITGHPLLTMAAHVIDDNGKQLAVLVGITELLAADLLGPIQDSRFGESGGFLVISPADKLFIVASDPAMTLTAMPQPGINLLHDRVMAGFRGTGTTVNAKGIEELSAIAAVPSTGWVVVARMPMQESLGVVDKVQRFILQGGLITAAIFIVIVGIYLRRVLRPLRDTAGQMRRMADGSMTLQRLPIVRHDEVGAMIAGFNRLADRLNEKEVALKERGLALEQALADLHENQARMTHMAHHDALTDLPNRALFEDRLRQAMARAERHGKQVALLFLDLDGFKPVNDNYGHEIGDTVLREVAERLRETVRRADTVARLGGDEFVIVLADLDEPRPTAQAVAEKCMEAIAPAFLVGDKRLTLGFSIGIALFPEDGEGVATLLARADHAMYRAKQGGRGRHEFFRAAP